MKHTSANLVNSVASASFYASVHRGFDAWCHVTAASTTFMPTTKHQWPRGPSHS
jgi:hypothetical protein